PLSALKRGAPATWFLPAATPAAARKQWIAGTLKPKGVITVDEGAARALAAGRSLLPAGGPAVEGRFERGDAGRVQSADGRDRGPADRKHRRAHRLSRPRRADPSRRSRPARPQLRLRRRFRAGRGARPHGFRTWCELSTTMIETIPSRAQGRSTRMLDRSAR